MGYGAPRPPSHSASCRSQGSLSMSRWWRSGDKRKAQSRRTGHSPPPQETRSFCAVRGVGRENQTAPGFSGGQAIAGRRFVGLAPCKAPIAALGPAAGPHQTCRPGYHRERTSANPGSPQSSCRSSRPRGKRYDERLNPFLLTFCSGRYLAPLYRSRYEVDPRFSSRGLRPNAERAGTTFATAQQISTL